MIKKVTQSRYMPPWKADPHYRSFIGEKLLTEDEIDLIAKWVDEGMPYGDSTIVLPEFHMESAKAILDSADITLTLNKAFALPDGRNEYFATFLFPLMLDHKVDVSAFQFVPGNSKIVHHAWMFITNPNYYVSTDSQHLFKSTLLSVEQNEFHFLDADFVNMFDNDLLYSPGYTALKYPEGMARTIPAKASLILQIHYVGIGKNDVDSSYINIYFSKDEDNRRIRYFLIDEDHIVNQPFLIPANTTKTFVSKAQLPNDISLLKIAPHMHYRGKSMKIYSLMPGEDTIPLLKIDNWDFNWQGIYTFKHPLKIPKGAEIIVESVFDNTDDNPANPVQPPVDVVQGWRSKDEMCQVILEYVDYVAGDEKINCDHY